jgi:hypothetical protein
MSEKPTSASAEALEASTRRTIAEERVAGWEPEPRFPWFLRVVGYQAASPPRQLRMRSTAAPHAAPRSNEDVTR